MERDIEGGANDADLEPSRPLLPSASSSKAAQPPQRPWGVSEYAKSIVYGGLDAIVTTFSLVSSISGGRMSSGDVLVLGFANLVADGISMGFSDMMSSTTETDVAESERKVTEWEVRNHMHEQALNLIGKYQDMGMTHTDAQSVVDVFSKYKDIMVQQEMANDKGILVSTNPNGELKEERRKAWKGGAVTLLSFLVFGCIPLMSYVVLIPWARMSMGVKFLGACLLSGMALVVLGIAKAKMSCKPYASSIAVSLLNGAVASSAAYFVGWFLRDVAGVEE